jgi:FXSXX-COOH protein
VRHDLALEFTIEDVSSPVKTVNGRVDVSDHASLVVEMDTTLANVGDLTLDDLMKIDNPILLESLRQVIREADDPQEIVAGFNSAI